MKLLDKTDSTPMRVRIALRKQGIHDEVHLASMIAHGPHLDLPEVDENDILEALRCGQEVRTFDQIEPIITECSLILTWFVARSCCADEVCAIRPLFHKRSRQSVCEGQKECPSYESYDRKHDAGTSCWSSTAR